MLWPYENLKCNNLFRSHFVVLYFKWCNFSEISVWAVSIHLVNDLVNGPMNVIKQYNVAILRWRCDAIVHVNASISIKPQYFQHGAAWVASAFERENSGGGKVGAAPGSYVSGAAFWGTTNFGTTSYSVFYIVKLTCNDALTRSVTMDRRCAATPIRRCLKFFVTLFFLCFPFFFF